MSAPDPQRPWYRHRWPWLLMAGPFLVIVAAAITIYLAVISNDGLVRDDYYKQGLAVNEARARDRQARSLELAAELMRGADGLQVRVLLRARPGTVLPAAVALRLAHPTRPGFDQNLVLRRENGSAQAAVQTYAGQLAAAIAGRWHVTIEDEANEWRLTGEWVVENIEVLRLPAVAPATRP